MTTLHVDLQDGFQHDSVVLRIDGKQIYKKDDVTTNLTISRADGVESSVAAAGVQVEIELPKRKIRASHRVKPAETSHVGISIEDGKPQFRVSAQAFLYM